jgi:hypothetical protein
MARNHSDENFNEADRFPLYSAIALCIIFIAIGIICPIDISLLLRLFIGVPVLLVASIVVAICVAFSKSRRRYLHQLTALTILLVISASFLLYDFKHPLVIRSAARWMVWSHGYKKEVLAQPAAASGDLKHIEWDGWGMFGQDTSVFLVFDPTDSLAMAAISRQPGKFNGLPCEVFLVRRLESHWYTVQNYTDQGWGGCN